MKKIIFTFALLCVFSCFVKAQGNSIGNRVLAQIQADGTITLKVTEAQLNTYLTELLNNVVKIKGTITKSQIILLSDKKSWVLRGKGTEGSGSVQSRLISVQLVIEGSQNLKVAAGGTTETCTGNPCSACDFLITGGCGCGDAAEGHTCNHTITKTNPN